MLETQSNTGPVTRAIAAMRDPGQEAAITRLLTADTPVRKPQIYGPGRERLRGASVAGLISLYEAHRKAGDVLSAETNSGRMERFEPAMALLFEHADWHDLAQEEVVAELESREPSDKWSRHYRLATLVDWYTERDEWAQVLRFATEAAEERA